MRNIVIVVAVLLLGWGAEAQVIPEGDVSLSYQRDGDQITYFVDGSFNCRGEWSLTYNDWFIGAAQAWHGGMVQPFSWLITTDCRPESWRVTVTLNIECSRAPKGPAWYWYRDSLAAPSCEPEPEPEPCNVFTEPECDSQTWNAELCQWEGVCGQY